MTQLADILIRRIAATGPITIADYMTECLLHPEYGYYSTHDPFGTAGDFTTAPEISQMFGELLGLCIAQTWLDQGSPEEFTLAELGPGRGTLMADILRVTNSVPGFRDAANLHLVEASETLRARQKGTLPTAPVVWHNEVSTLPEAPLFLVANEFFDALPIRQFSRNEAGWCERQVGIQNNKLTLGLSAPAPITLLSHRLEDTKPGDIVELCPPAGPIVGSIAGRISKHGGCALVIDYGNWRSLGDTFQAIRNHKPVNPLDQPGQTDLTAHVDFEALSNAATDVAISQMTTQGVLLERLGITPRTQALAQSLRGKALEDHISAHRRLTHMDEMGSLFKAIALHPIGSLLPAGFGS